MLADEAIEIPEGGSVTAGAHNVVGLAHQTVICLARNHSARAQVGTEKVRNDGGQSWTVAGASEQVPAWIARSADVVVGHAIGAVAVDAEIC